MSLEFSGRTLGEVFITHRSQLRSIARKIVGTPEMAEDILQDAYLKLVEGVCVRQIEKPFCYCCQVVRNLALDHCRRQSVEATYRVFTEEGELHQVAGHKAPDDGVHARQMLGFVDKALNTLPERTRHAFELYRLSGMTQREIAQKMGCSATLVNFMVRDAVEVLAGCSDMRV
jgi:RNA polymerase sigma factor (sigma-70 family)